MWESGAPANRAESLGAGERSPSPAVFQKVHPLWVGEALGLPASSVRPSASHLLIKGKAFVRPQWSPPAGGEPPAVHRIKISDWPAGRSPEYPHAPAPGRPRWCAGRRRRTGGPAPPALPGSARRGQPPHLHAALGEAGGLGPAWASVPGPKTMAVG